MRIDVTREDIEVGEAGGCLTCPVALALNRATGLEWFVDRDAARIRGDQTWLRLPAEVADWIAEFDAKESWSEFDPFWFEWSY
jgi:hypothetical protein